MSAKDALMRYSEHHLDEMDKARGPKRKNGKPEFEVKKLVMKWLKENGWSCHVIESKAVYSYEAGRYIHGQTEPGVADIFGSTPSGIAAFIELKAPGKRSTLKEHQRAFLISKIDVGAFAICTDSVALLEKTAIEFEHRRKIDPHLSRAFLLKLLQQNPATHALFEK